MKKTNHEFSLSTFAATSATIFSSFGTNFSYGIEKCARKRKQTRASFEHAHDDEALNNIQSGNPLASQSIDFAHFSSTENPEIKLNSKVYFFIQFFYSSYLIYKVRQQQKQKQRTTYFANRQRNIERNIKQICVMYTPRRKSETKLCRKGG